MSKFPFAINSLDGEPVYWNELRWLRRDNPILNHLVCPGCGSKLVFRHGSHRSKGYFASEGSHAISCAYGVLRKNDVEHFQTAVDNGLKISFSSNVPSNVKITVVFSFL